MLPSPAIDTRLHADAPNGSRRPEGERRQLTVLFCDLVGSTELAGRMDPEDWSEIATQYQRTAAEAATRFGGHVAKFLGDGLVVYFGWPLAHGDDAERAVRGGLAMLNAIAALNQRLAPESRVTLAARIGIDTGLVVVGEGGGADAEVFGDTPNVAARVQALASADSVFVTAATHRLVAGLFVVEDEGAHPLKGIPVPVTLYRVRRASGVRRRLDATNASALTPFVGRTEARELLRSRWERARAGEGQVVLITGEAGIGKSRLLQVLKEDLEGEPHTWIECAGSPYQQNTPFFPIVDMLHQGLAWRGDESTEERLAALGRALELGGVQAAEALPLVAPLLGLSMPDQPAARSREGQRRKLLASLAAWLFGVARVQPVVLVIEDLHWVDPSTLELLGLFNEQGGTVPLLLLYATRPELEAPWPVLGHHALLALNRLEREQVREMVGRVSAAAPLPERVVEAVVARSDGVPLFAEELTRLVVERQASAFEIPATLQDSLMARLDRLGSAKEVAQIGAVIGREFTYALLQQVSARSEEELDGALAKLADAELLYARGVKPAVSYVFKHALVRDTAYGSLLKSRRRELHRSIAEALAAQFPVIAEGQPELLAHHYTEGGCVSEAIAQWHRAGQRALERSANAEAVNHLQRGLALLAAQPEGLERTYKELAFRMPLGIGLIASTGYASDDVAHNLARARSLCQELGSVPELVLFGLWFFNLVRADREVTTEMAGQLLALAEQTGDTTHRLLAHSAMTSTAHFQGDAVGAREHAAKVLALYDRERHGAIILGTGLDPAVSARFYDAGSLWFLGYPDQAVTRVDEALALARHAPHALALAGALAFSTAIRAWRGEPDAADVLAKELAALSREHGLPVWRAFGVAEQGRALVQRGDAAGGLALIDEGIAIYRATGAFLNIHGLLCIRAEACLALGDVTDGLGTCDEGLARTERQIDCNQEAELRRLKGELLLLQNGDAAAEASFIHAIDVARAQCSRAWELRAATSLSRLWRRQGKRGPARQLLAPLVAWYTEGFTIADLVTAQALLAELG